MPTLLLPVFPLKKAVCYVPQGLFSQLGRPEEEIPDYTTIPDVIITEYEDIQQDKWSQLIQGRIRVEEARRKFSHASTMHSSSRPLTDVPGWKDATIESYRLQFRIIDLNGDGLIDFKEMCAALDKIGDTSSNEERKKYFREIDKDKSDGIDFDEFLELIVRVREQEGEEEGCLTKLCQSTVLNVQEVFQITQLSPQELIQFGLL